MLAVQAAAVPYTAIIAEEGLVPKATIRLSGCVNISSFSSQLSLRNRVHGRPTQVRASHLSTTVGDHVGIGDAVGSLFAVCLLPFAFCSFVMSRREFL